MANKIARGAAIGVTGVAAIVLLVSLSLLTPWLLMVLLGVVGVNVAFWKVVCGTWILSIVARIIRGK